MSRESRAGRGGRRPLLHFALLGGALYAAVAALEPVPTPQVTIPAERVAALERSFARRNGHAPGTRERAGLVRMAVEDELWVREALALGLLETDPVVRRRLVQVARFLDASLAGDAEALEAARELGLHGTDPVVRRRLIERLRGSVRARAREEPVSEEELRQAFARDPQRYLLPLRLRITHVFFSRDRHGAGLAARAARELALLRETDVSPAAALGRGDPFVHGQRVGPRSVAGLEGLFGPEFARSLEALPAGRWSGPVASAYGVHLVFIDERIPVARPPLSEVAARVREDVLDARVRAALERALDQLRSRYAVRVEQGA